MGRFKRGLAIVLSAICSLVCFSACGHSEEKQQEITEMFASFGYENNFVLLGTDAIFYGEETIDLSQLKYEGMDCGAIVCMEDGFYAYAYEEWYAPWVDLLWITYDDLTMTKVDRLEFKNGEQTSKYNGIVAYYNGAFCFNAHRDKDNRFVYYVYDLKTKGMTEYLDEKPYGFAKYMDSGRSDKYELIYHDKMFNSYIEVIDKKTGERKKIENKLLTTCEEGKKIKKLSKICRGNGFHVACEKDGEIYVANFYCTDGFLGEEKIHYFIMKYDFSSNTLQYYTSFLVENGYNQLKEMLIL
jgi:hypothetical protein